MHPAPDRLLWASREARSLENLAPPPPCEIVGGYLGVPQRTAHDPGAAQMRRALTLYARAMMLMALALPTLWLV